MVGERWTLLVVRELLLGPKRYTDLEGRLGGISPKVLSTRLTHLLEADVVRRRALPPPAASIVYELTDLGEELRPAVRELTRWGLNFLGAPRPNDRVRLSWLMRSLEASFRPEEAVGISATYEFRIDGEPFNIRVDAGRMEVHDGPAAAPVFTYESDMWTFAAVGSKHLDPVEAVQSGLARVGGDLEAGLRAIEVFGPSLGGTSGGLLGAIGFRLRGEATRGVHEEYEFHAGDQVFHVRADDGRASVAAGPAEAPAVTVAADLGTLLAIGVDRLAFDEARREGRLQVVGDEDALRRALRVLDIRT